MCDLALRKPGPKGGKKMKCKRILAAFLFALVLMSLTSCVSESLYYDISDMRPIGNTKKTITYELPLTETIRLKDKAISWASQYVRENSLTYSNADGDSIPSPATVKDDGDAIEFSFVFGKGVRQASMLAFDVSGVFPLDAFVYSQIDVRISFAGATISIESQVGGAFAPDVGYFEDPKDGLDFSNYKYYSRLINDDYDDRVREMRKSFTQAVFPGYVKALNDGEIVQADFNRPYRDTIRDEDDTIGYVIHQGETTDLLVYFINEGSRGGNSEGWVCEIWKIDNDTRVRRGSFEEFEDSSLTVENLVPGDYLIIINPASAKGNVTTGIPYTIEFSIGDFDVEE